MEQIVSQYEIPGTKCKQKTGKSSTINGTDCEPIWNPRDRNESRKMGNYLLPMEQIVSQYEIPGTETKAENCAIIYYQWNRLWANMKSQGQKLKQKIAQLSTTNGTDCEPTMESKGGSEQMWPNPRQVWKIRWVSFNGDKLSWQCCAVATQRY